MAHIMGAAGCYYYRGFWCYGNVLPYVFSAELPKLY